MESPKLLFKAGWKLVSLGESRREAILALVVPTANNFAIMQAERSMTVGIVIVAFVVSVSMSVPLPLRKSGAGGQG